jgi:hypothetical protein
MIEKRCKRELAVAAGNWIESSGVGSWQLADDGGVERVQLRVESQPVKKDFTCAVVQLYLERVIQ